MESVKEMRRVAERLRNKMAYDGERWVMVKGGHLPGNDTIDLLHDGDRMIELPGHRIETANTHGTGCTCRRAGRAAAADRRRARGGRRAKAYLTEAIRQSDRLSTARATARCTTSTPGGERRAVTLPRYRRRPDPSRPGPAPWRHRTLRIGTMVS
ncbi:bifunctional hydroxymethylpyrimidine kinase/phosphomethylpyrimidine kinase [Achromobacter xylosoxidans]